ncbi:MAG TPA: UDP-N-acetylmuramoyl-tripeptide--D-alanyl-D-alanine ligase [Gemmatimonadales bacterium]|nr:UDP-N-acetylmuramoyl-tripeptide--D-alanyl-D-alanine ligase [Gemmatimonadales bacterium]
MAGDATAAPNAARGTTWTEAEVRRALAAPVPASTSESAAKAAAAGLVFSGISTDTRRLAPGALFVALAGERFDAHGFLAAAASAGAIGAVVRRGTAPVAGLRLFAVDDTLRAYGALAHARRARLTGPVVAVTGSNGKTSTKEMLAAVLATRYRTYATRANLNNLVGVPATILEGPPDVEAMVVEAGANLPGEIARYRDIIDPAITVITNATAGHLEGFGSLAGVLAEKLALARGVALAVVGREPPALAAGARELARRVVTAGLADADRVPTRVAIDSLGRATVEVDGRRFTLPYPGRHLAENAMLAWTVARELGLDLDAAAGALGRFTVPAGRSELRQEGALTILDDSYNANPASFRAAIATAADLRGGRRLVFVAGTMRELGPDAARLHAEVAQALVALEPDLLGAVGEFVPALAPHAAQLGARLVTAPDAETIAPLVAERLRGDEVVVLKASRGVALERILPALVARAH